MILKEDVMNNNTTFLKRAGAFILDAFIFSLIFGIFMMIIPESTNVTNLNINK